VIQLLRLRKRSISYSKFRVNVSESGSSRNEGGVTYAAQGRYPFARLVEVYASSQGEV
jgi:hypothetical protein